MSAEAVLEELRARGINLFPAGGKLKYRCPQGAMTEDLLKLLRQHKTALLELLQDGIEAKTPLGKVGQHGNPCPECGDTWQWPTTRGEWLCSWCFVQGQRVVREGG